MASLDIDSQRREYPGKSDQDIAEILAQQYGYIAVVRYKSHGAAKYTNFGVCTSENEISGYFNSAYCDDVELIYDGRANSLAITEALILKGQCDICEKKASHNSLTVMSGNDFYICGKCAKMFCDGCYSRLPLTNGHYGYGVCPDCLKEVQRAIPGYYGK